MTWNLYHFWKAHFKFKFPLMYPTHDIELAAIIHALRMWRHYLMGRKFLLKRDNMSVKYLFDQPDLNVRQARWFTFLSKYHFDLKHIKGKDNKVVDALS